jgi:hypothetical protein
MFAYSIMITVSCCMGILYALFATIITAKSHHFRPSASMPQAEYHRLFCLFRKGGESAKHRGVYRICKRNYFIPLF